MTNPPVRSDKPALWWAVAGAYALLIAAVSVLPSDGGVSVGRLDKLAHLCEYAIFAWCLRRAAQASAFSRLRGLLFALSIATLYGAWLELIQGALGYRTAEWGDVIANAAGAWLGAGLYRRTT